MILVLNTSNWIIRDLNKKQLKILVYFMDNDKMNFGTQTIAPALEMTFFKENLKTLTDIDVFI